MSCASFLRNAPICCALSICSCRIQWLTDLLPSFMQRIQFPDLPLSSRRSFVKRRRSHSPPSPGAYGSQEYGSYRAQPSFRSGTDGRVRPICAVCLGRHKHELKYCRAPYFVSASGAPTHTPTRCRRDSKGRLFNNQGGPVCYNWQRPQKCDAIGPDHVYLHKCSACGDRNHGALQCTLRTSAMS